MVDIEEKQILWLGYAVILIATFLVLLNYNLDVANDDIYTEKIAAANVALLHDAAKVRNVDSEIKFEKSFNYFLEAERGECRVYANFEDDISKLDAWDFGCLYLGDEEVKHINANSIKVSKGGIV